jgi:hypothetical protein
MRLLFIAILVFGSVSEAAAWGRSHSHRGYHSSGFRSHSSRGETCWRTNRSTGQRFRVC